MTQAALQLGSGGAELVTVIADAVDYCRVAARRIEVDSIAADVDGDHELAAGLLAAAAIVAV